MKETELGKKTLQRIYESIQINYAVRSLTDDEMLVSILEELKIFEKERMNNNDTN